MKQLLLCLFLLAPYVMSQTPAPGHIVVDPGQRFQRIDGFGLNFTGPYFREDQTAMFDKLVNDLGATMFRVVAYLVYSNWEEVNDNDDPAVMNWEYYNNRYSGPIFEASWAALRHLNSRGIRPIIALMGPAPDWMLDDKAPPPRHKVCQGSTSPPGKTAPLVHLNPAMYEEFAEEVVSMAVYARTQAHIDFEYFSPFNETDCYPPEGPRIDPDEVGPVLAVIARRLKKEGLGDVKLTVADQAVITNDYISPIWGNRELMQQVGAFTLHTYGENSVGPQVERVSASEYRQVPVWLTEYGDLNDQDKTAENDWKRFSLAANRRALTALNEGARALFFFNAFDDYEECARRLTFYGLFSSANHVYSPKKRYYATRQLYHFVRPGSQRIAARTDVPGLTVSAFRDGSSNTLAIVGVKERGPGPILVSLPRTGPAPDSWEVYETSPTLDCVKVDTVITKAGVAQIDLPDEVIFTLVGTIK